MKSLAKWTGFIPTPGGVVLGEDPHIPGAYATSILYYGCNFSDVNQATPQSVSATANGNYAGSPVSKSINHSLVHDVGTPLLWDETDESETRPLANSTEGQFA